MMAKLLSRSSFYGFCLLLALPVAVRAQQDRIATSASQSDEAPPETRYLFLFRQLAGSPSQNQTSDQSGPRGARPNYRAMLQRSADLSDEEARALNLIADNCMQKVTELDKRASEIIAAHRAENRSRKITPGDSLTPPPAELSRLQQDRNNVVVSAIEQLRVAFGDAEFKRFDEYVQNHGDVRRAVIPSANKKPLPIQVTITLFDRDGATSRKQFAANERVIVQVAMLNNSSQMIAVKESEVYGWLRLIPTHNRTLPLGLPLHMRASNGGSESAVDVPPAQLIIVGRIELGPGAVELKPDEYRFVLPHKALLNRPPSESEWLQFSFSGSEEIVFEIVP